MLATTTSRDISPSNGVVSCVKEEPLLEEGNKMTNNGNSSDVVPILEDDNQLYQFKPYTQNDCCDLNPEFAVICSFISHFGDKLDFKLDIKKLKTSIEDQKCIDEGLIDLHVKLLRKVRRYFVRDQWEKILIRFASEYSYEDAYELEVLGYKKSRPSIKLELLRRLMEAQFECDQKFKASINLSEANELRILPLGRDVRGNTYWQRTDSEGNLRVFQEEPLNYKSWKTVCATTDDLGELIDQLKSEKDLKIKGEPIKEPYNPLPEVFPDFFVKEIKKEEEVESPGKKTARVKRNRSRAKNLKSSSLPALKEAKEEEEFKKVKLRGCNIKPEHTESTSQRLFCSNQLNHTSDNILAPKPRSFSDHTVETQVKSTLENLLSVVVSSFDYIIKPLSRTSSPQNKEQSNEVEPQKKKRITKRNKPREEILPRRTSSRIQQIQMKKIAEQEEEMKKMFESNASKKAGSITSFDDDSRSRSSSSKSNKRRSESPQNVKGGRRKRNKNQSWKRGKGKKKLSWDKDDSDLSSTSSLTESNEDDFEDLDNSFKFDSNNYDDEFACEDEETNIEPVIVKRARTARQSLGFDDLCDQKNSSILEEDKPCGRCDKSNDPEWILLCDSCDDGYHTSCCLPPLMIVPDGDWFCPSCEHKTLIIKLIELQSSIIEILEEKERERKKNQRLRQIAIKKEPISIDTQSEILLPKRKNDIIHELNDPLAMQALDLERTIETDSEDSFKERSRKRTKKASKLKKTARRKTKYEEDTAFRTHSKRPRKTYSRRTMIESDESENESNEQQTSSSDEIAPKTRRACASVSYRFQEYDDLIKSAIHGDTYADEESHTDSVPSNSNYGKGKDMATIEALAYQQENGITDAASTPKEENQQEDEIPRKRGKKKGRRLNDLDAASESENTTSDESFQATSATEAEDEEEEDDDELTEEDVSGDEDTSLDELIDISRCKSNKKKKMNNKKSRNSYESDDSECQPTRSRRAAAAKNVSYRESTDEDDTILESNEVNKRSISSGDESQASWRSQAASFVEDDDNQSTSCAESLELKIDETKSINESPPLAVVVKQKDKVVEKEHKQDSPAALTMQDTSDEIVTAHTSIPNETLLQIQKPIVKVQAVGSEKPIKQKQEQTVVHHKVNSKLNVAKSRDPIQELNQYCSESANSAFMFKSYNDTLMSKSSPIHPPFYEEDMIRPASSTEKSKKVRTSKITVRPLEVLSKEKTGGLTSMSEVKVSNIPPQPIRTRAPNPPNSLPSSTLRQPILPIVTDATTTSQRYQNPQSQVVPHAYNMQPTNITYARSPYPGKYTQQHAPSHSPPQNQVHRYPNTYGGHINNFSQQSPRPTTTNSPYPTAQIQGRMWNPSIIASEGPRQPMLNMYYEQGAPMPNPNFSIHQLLRSPYSIDGLSSSSTVPLPSSGSISHLHTPTSTQTSVSSEPNDKDIIRGMSDVISFIGDI